MEAVAAKQRHVVVLFDAVAADAEAADQAAVLVQRHAAGEPHNSALIQVATITAAARPGAFGARVLRVVDVEIEERSFAFVVIALLELLLEVHSRWEPRLAAEVERARGDRPALARRRIGLPAVALAAALDEPAQYVVAF